MFDLKFTNLKTFHFFDVLSHKNFEALNKDVFIKALKGAY